MSWSPLTPPAPPSRRGKTVTVSVRNFRNGRVVRASFSRLLMEQMGLPDALDVELGAGESEGMLRFTVNNTTGRFPVVMMGAGCGARVSIAAFPGVPARPMKATYCDLVEDGASGVTVRLPVWSSDIPKPQVVTDHKLDAIGYLQGKGHQISFDDEGRTLVNGDRLAPSAILAMVNRLRARENLPPLQARDLAA